VTQIGSPTVAVLSGGNDLPAPILLGPDGRLPPTRSLAEGIEFYEALEGMLVTVQAPVVVGPTNAFGEVYAIVATGRAASTPPGSASAGRSTSRAVAAAWASPTPRAAAPTSTPSASRSTATAP
jgi:hypothetical protein